MITCYIRYTLNMNQLAAFAEYGRLWIQLINKLGGHHHGYFVPSNEKTIPQNNSFSFKGMGTEGPTNIGIAIFSFPDRQSYDYYKEHAKNYDECIKATRIVEETKCFTRYERNFMDKINES